MGKSKVKIINKWVQLLKAEFKTTEFSLTEDILIEILNLIESSYEGHIYCNTDNKFDVAIVCLMLKHFSIVTRCVILDAPSTLESSDFDAVGLEPWVKSSDDPQSYLYLFSLSLNTLGRQIFIHPLGGSIIDSKLIKLQPSNDILTLFSKPAFSLPKRNSSTLSFNDIIFLKSLFSNVPKKDSIHFLILAMDPSQQIEQLIELVQSTHPQCFKKITIISPFFYPNVFDLNWPNTSISFIESPWGEELKSYRIESKIDFAFFDSSNFDLILSSNLNYLLPLLKTIDFFCFNHCYSYEELIKYSDYFIDAYKNNFVKDLVEISKLTDDMATIFSPIFFDDFLQPLSLPNNHRLLPSKTKCRAFKFK